MLVETRRKARNFRVFILTHIFSSKTPFPAIFSSLPVYFNVWSPLPPKHCLKILFKGAFLVTNWYKPKYFNLNSNFNIRSELSTSTSDAHFAKEMLATQDLGTWGLTSSLAFLSYSTFMSYSFLCIFSILFYSTSIRFSSQVLISRYQCPHRYVSMSTLLGLNW